MKNKKTHKVEFEHETRKANIDQGKNEYLFGFNKYLQNKKLIIQLLIILDLLVFFILNGLINYIPFVLKNALSSYHYKFNLGYCFNITKTYGFAFIYFLFSIPLCAYTFYKINVSFNNLNIGQKGNERWTTDEELKEQYLAIDEIIDEKNKKFTYFTEGNDITTQQLNYENLYNRTFKEYNNFIDYDEDYLYYSSHYPISLQKILNYIATRYDFDNFIVQAIKELQNCKNKLIELKNNGSDDMLFHIDKTSFFEKLEDLEKGFVNLRGIKAEYDYEGNPGMPISYDRANNKIYIDQTYTHSLVLGISRAGKGESFVIPTHDILSRVKLKPSIVSMDPKMENYKMSASTFQRRGYINWCLNIVTPKFSMGFNPIYLVIHYYKLGDYSRAEAVCKTVATSIYNPNKESGDTFWDDNSVALFTAMVLAMTDDCIKADRLLKNQYYKNSSRYHQEPNQNFYLDFEERLSQMSKKFKKKIANLGKKFLIDLITQDTTLNYSQRMILLQLSNDEITLMNKDTIDIMTTLKYSLSKDRQEFKTSAIHFFIENYLNELGLDYYVDKINLYSMQLTFSQLQRTKTDKKEETMLDVFFNSRPDLDRAKLKWTSIEVAGDRTKGSIFSSMLTQIEVFTYTDIARITSKNDMDLSKLGFGDRPIALFIALPDYDPSFNFLATILISQIYYVNSQIASEKKGICERPIVFIDDEIFNCPAIPDFQNMLNVQLGRHMKSILFAQSLSQIPMRYPEKEAKTIKSAMHNTIYLMLSDYDECAEFAKLIGSETILNVARSGQRFSIDKNFNETYDDKQLISANELQQLAQGESVVKRVLHRTTLDGQDHLQTPIFNRNNRRAKLRYQYLTRDFPNPETVDLVKQGYLKENDVELEHRVYNFTAYINNKRNKNLGKEKPIIWNMTISEVVDQQIDKKFVQLFHQADDENLFPNSNAFLNKEVILELKVYEFYDNLIKAEYERFSPRLAKQLKDIFQSYLTKAKKEYEDDKKKMQQEQQVTDEIDLSGII